MGEMGHVWTKNQHSLTSLNSYLIKSINERLKVTILDF